MLQRPQEPLWLMALPAKAAFDYLKNEAVHLRGASCVRV